MKKWWLIAYDIRDDRRLRKVAKLLESYGRRMQYSVFFSYLNQRDMEKLKWEITCITEPEDSIIYIGLCPSCVEKINPISKRPKITESFQIY